MDPTDEEHVWMTVSVCTGSTFCQWLFGFGEGIRIISAVKEADAYQEAVQNW